MTSTRGAKKPGSKVTIFEVADLVGVSVATVSRAFNDGRISSETHRRVFEAAERLGYVPSSSARSLSMGRSLTMGVVIPDVTGPLYGQMLRGVNEMLGLAGYFAISAASGRDPARELKVLKTLKSRDVDALILIGSGVEGEALDLELAKLPPAVLVEREGNRVSVPVITLDNFKGGLIATRYLLGQGHTRVAHLAGPRRAGSERHGGYARVLAEAGLPSGPVANGGFTEPGGYMAMKVLLDRGGFSAVFIASDRMAMGAYKALREAGLHVPRDVSVVGFDNLPFAAYLAPALTTIRQPAFEMGRLAAEVALRSLRGGESESYLLDCELVIRDSVQRL